MSRSTSSSHLLMPILLLIFLITGCSHHYDAKKYPIKPGMVPEFRGGKPITIMNAKESSEVVLIGTQGFHKWYGDLQKWSGTAIEVLKHELENRDISVVENAEKKIMIEITRVHLHWEFFTIRCILTLKVETGDGYTREVEGNNASPATLYRACNGAVTRAVAAILNDDTILAYLKF